MWVRVNITNESSLCVLHGKLNVMPGEEVCFQNQTGKRFRIFLTSCLKLDSDGMGVRNSGHPAGATPWTARGTS